MTIKDQEERLISIT